MNKINRKNLVVNILLLLISVTVCALLFVLIIEAKYFIETRKYLSQAWHDPNTKFDSELGWSPIPNRRLFVPDWGTITSNSLGFRSPEIDQNKKQIIVLGDSHVWGFGVNDVETFPYYLNEMVSKFGYQVSNLGVSGYDLGQYYLFLKKHIDKFNNLRLVVLVINTENDYICTGANFDSGKKKPLFIVENNNLILTNKVINEHCLRNLFSRSYFLGRSWPQNIIGDLLSIAADDRVLNQDELKEVSVTLLQKIFELVVNHRAKLLVVIKPSKKDFVNKTFSLNFFQYVFNELKFKELSCIDYMEVLKKEDQKDLNSFYLEDEHYNRKGNEFLAKTVSEQIQKMVKE